MYTLLNIIGILVHCPDIWHESFYVKTHLRVHYDHGGIELIADDGNRLLPEATRDPPSVNFDPPDEYCDRLHTLVLMDIDFPSVQDPNAKDFVLWMIVDIPRGSAKDGETLIAYQVSLLVAYLSNVDYFVDSIFILHMPFF